MMKTVIVLCIISVVMVPPAAAAGKDLTGVPALKAGYGQTPLVFIPNHGQVDHRVRFHAATPGFSLWLTVRGMVFDSGGVSGRDVSQLQFIGSSDSPAVEASEVTGHRVNFMRGSDNRHWRSGVPTSKAVLYRDLYPGIRLKVYGSERQLEYDWVVAPGADPAVIQWRYSNIKKTGIDGSGNLRIKTAGSELVHNRPVSFQVIDGRRVPVAVTFKRTAVDTYCFAVGRYDNTRPLIIDPVVVGYSTYLGGTEDNSGVGIAVDNSGCAYVAGYTRSMDFPLANPLQGQLRNWLDCFVTKFSADGRQLIYSTYLGGSDSDMSRDIVVDADGSAYVTGVTYSSDFPVKNAFMATSKDNSYAGDVFLSKLSPDGSQLLYSTYLGGDNWDESMGLAVDATGSACVAGYTHSKDFPLKNPLKEASNDNYYSEGFITKFSPEGDQLVFSTYFGGDFSETIDSIAVDGSGAIYITGYTDSYNFPTVNPLQEMKGYNDCFVSKISSDGSQLIFSTYLGGIEYEYGKGIAVDAEGFIYVTGSTGSSDFPLVNAFQDHLKYGYDEDCFVTKYAPDGSSLVYSTYLGGSGWDEAEDIAVDGSGSVLVAGHTASPDFPSLHAIKETLIFYDDDAFITKFSPQGTLLEYSTFVGGKDYDKGIDLALDVYGNAYITGYTHSKDFPVHNAFQANQPAVYGDSAFVIKILNLLFRLEVTRHEERGWLIRKEFGEVVLTVQNIGLVPIQRFILYRKDSKGDYMKIKELVPSTGEKNYHIDVLDWQIDKNESYTYIVKALDADGNVIAASNEETI